MSLVYLNGEYLPAEQASISVMDRGFLFGDGIYEVVPVFAGTPFRMTEHLRRLRYSLEQVAIDLDYSDQQWLAIFEPLIEGNGGGDQSLYIQITRGVAPKRQHHFPEAITPTVFAMSRPLVAKVSEEKQLEGIKVISSEDIRWRRCDIKSTSLLANVLLTQQAIDAGVDEVILLRDGLAWEGASSNLFAVAGDNLLTAPKSPDILGGITRELILELGVRHGLEILERPLTEQELRGADEIWISSSTREIMPVIELDGVAVGSGQVGAVYEQVMAWYRDYKQQNAR